MIRRTLTGLLATCLIAAVIWWALVRVDPTLAAAANLMGERWYQLSMHSEPIGYYHARARRNAAGELVFETKLRFALAAGQPVTVQESYRFAATAPHRLSRARHQVQRNAAPAGVRIERSRAALIATRWTGDDTEPAQTLPWDFALADYLAFEAWLRDQHPQAGASIAIRSPNLNRLTLDAEVFQLIERTRAGFRVRKKSLLDDTIIELGADFAPTHFQLAGVFELERTTEAIALQSRSRLRESSYRLLLNEPLVHPQRLERLELQVTGVDAPGFPNPLVLKANPLIDALPEQSLGASLEHPVDHPRLKAALAALNLTGSPDHQVSMLLDHVHRFISYDDTVASRTVLDLLDDPAGDCTEFADLFTTLARAAGIPSSTVIGMAYTDDPLPALAFHAWNQVHVNGQWRAVDPTWNQLRVDATHWPLPAGDASALRLLTGQVDIRLQVKATEYQLAGQRHRA